LLNQHLPEGQLHDELKEFLEAWNWIIGQLFPEKEISVFQDKKLLSILHHSLNVGKYKQKSFRQQLFSFAPDDEIVEFTKKCSVSYSSFEETRTLDFRNRIASFNWGNNNETRNFVKVFDYPDYLIPSKDEKFESVQQIVPSQNPFKQLKDFQSNVVFKILEHIEYPNKKLLIQMPTGAGKTRVAMEVISHFLNKKEARQVIWLADRLELCEQACETFLNVWSHLGKRPLNLYRIWGDYTIPNKLEGTSFVVAMYQKIRNPLRNGRLQMKGDLLVPDEAHNVVAPTHNEIIQNLKDRHAKQTRLLGLTATPGRGTGGDTKIEELVSFFNRIIGIESDDGVISYLQRKRILAKCIRKPLHTNIEYTLTRDEWKNLSKSFEHEYPDDLLERIANDQKRNLIIMIRLLELAKDCNHILVFSGGIIQSKLLAGLMIALNYSAAHVDGTSPPDYRKDTVNKFRNGEIQFVFNYGVFTAGFDAPKIDAVVIIRPTTSVVLYGQMIGRGMRGPEMDGTEEFQLIDVVDNIITEYGGLDNVYEFFAEYWEN